MTMIKQLDGIKRRRRGDVVAGPNGKALPPEAYDIFFHDDHVGYTQRLDGGKFRAFPVDGSFPTEEYKNHTEAVRALVQAFKPGSAPAAEAPAADAPAAASAPAKSKAKAKAAAKPVVTTQLSLVKDEDITPDPLADAELAKCERCGSTEPHTHATAVTPAEVPEAAHAGGFEGAADGLESVPADPPPDSEWAAGYPEGPRPDAGNPFAALPPIAPADTAAEEPGWMPGPGFAPATPPFEPATVPSFLPPSGSDDPFDDTDGFTDPFASL